MFEPVIDALTFTIKKVIDSVALATNQLMLIVK